jgi:hypothetical protein
MRFIKSFVFTFALLSLVLSSASFAHGKTILYRFQFLTQGASAFAPADNKRIQLRFQNSPKVGFYANTNDQGIADFKLERCNEEDNAELVYRSDFADKKQQRVQVTISCGTEDVEATSYFMGIYSLTYGKYLASSLDGLDGPCYSCKQEQ